MAFRGEKVSGGAQQKPSIVWISFMSVGCTAKLHLAHAFLDNLIHLPSKLGKTRATLTLKNVLQKAIKCFFLTVFLLLFSSIIENCIFLIIVVSVTALCANMSNIFC